MWQELEGKMKLSEVMIRDAVDTCPDILISVFPYCLNMLEDAMKTACFEGRGMVMDLNELLLESLNLG